MADFKKFVRAAALRILGHNCREEMLSADEIIALGIKRENIDASRTTQNYDLAEQDRRIILCKNGTERRETAREKYSRRYSEIDSEYENKTTTYTRKNRKTGLTETIKKQLSIQQNADSLCGWVVTAPKDLPEAEHETFFKLCYDFIAEKYGRENIIAANVHNDEAQPHIHISFIPIVPDKKNGGNKLCANNLETPKSLSRFHQDLSKILEKNMGHKVNVLNGATVGGNLSITQLKLQEMMNQLVQTAIDKIDADMDIQLQKLILKVNKPLLKLHDAIEKRSFFKGKHKEQFEQVVALSEQAKMAMQSIVDFKDGLQEQSDALNARLDDIFEHAQTT